MNSVLAQRRRDELRTKLASLKRELEHWKALTEDADKGLRRHHSQVRLLKATIEALIAPTEKSSQENAADSDAVLQNAAAWETELLSVYSIWDVFRSKLALRQDDFYRDRLAACDDLAWECYRPAMERFGPERKEPPLVYLTPRWTPFAKRRYSNFQQDAVAAGGPAGTLTDQRFQAVLKQMPVAMVGIPWYDSVYLPGALLIAHEVGHVVEWEFGLTGEIRAALDGAGLEHSESWRSWASETFADLYGVLAMGAAFCGALMDLLAVSKSTVNLLRHTGGDYPTQALRMALVLEALRLTGNAAEAARLKTIWEATYTQAHAMPDYDKDVPKVAEALYRGPYHGARLWIKDDPAGCLLNFPASERISAIGKSAANGFPLEGYTDPRELFAASQWVHENITQPAARARAFDNLVRQIVLKYEDVFRYRGKPVPAKEDLEAELLAQEQAARRKGPALRDQLFKPAPAYPPRASGPPDRPE